MKFEKVMCGSCKSNLYDVIQDAIEDSRADNWDGYYPVVTTVIVQCPNCKKSYDVMLDTNQEVIQIDLI